jgi:NUMOD3 motif
MGGTDDKENLVLLTTKEHFICHLLLTKMCIDPIHTQKMIWALNITMNTKYTRCNSRLYASIRESVGRKLSERMRGIPKSAEQKEKMVETKRRNGTLNHSEATKKRMRESHQNRPPQSEETRRKRSESLQGRKQSPEHIEKLAATRRGRKTWNTGIKPGDPNYERLLGRIVSNYTREKLSKTHKGKPSLHAAENGRKSAAKVSEKAKTRRRAYREDGSWYWTHILSQ